VGEGENLLRVPFVWDCRSVDGHLLPTLLSFCSCSRPYSHAVTGNDFFLSCRTKMFFKGCLTSLNLFPGGIKLLASPGFIVGCQVKVSSLFESLFMAMVAFLRDAITLWIKLVCYSIAGLLPDPSINFVPVPICTPGWREVL